MAIVLTLIFLLAVPLTLTYQVSSRQDIQSDVTLQWAFGLVRRKISSQRVKATPPDHDEAGQKVGPVERSSRNNGRIFAAVRQKEFRRRIVRFVSDLWHAVDKKDVGLRLRLGLGDPVDTGQLWAVVGPIAGILASVQDATIEIEPEFFDVTFELDSSGCLRIIPLQLIYLMVALLLSPRIWHGISRTR